MRSPHSSSSVKSFPIYDTDTPAMRESIEKLRELKYFIRRDDRIALKLGRVNFWPSTGTITIDGEGKYDGGRGLDDLLALLAERFPPHTSYTPKRAPASQKPRLVPSTPPADLHASAHFAAIFDDEDSDETPL